MRVRTTCMCTCTEHMRMMPPRRSCARAPIRAQIWEIFIQFVARTGYKDEPEVDKDNEQQPLLFHRTTAVHQVSKYVYPRYHPESIVNLFRVYDKVDVTYLDESGQNHFHVACRCGLEDIVEQFLEAGQDPNYLWASTGDSPLHLALENRHPFVVRLLLKHGADPNLADRNGFTPLHWMLLRFKVALTIDHFFRICDDLKKPVQIDAQDEWGQTPLFLALGRSHNRDVIELLLRRGANPHLTNKNGLSPIDMICTKWSDDDLVDMFKIIDERYQPGLIYVRDQSGNTPLHIAQSRDHRETVQFLLTNGAYPNFTNDHRWTPL
ncbi:unnamed protein product [Trichogramma brassicae]|uniref:Uncharacterized protein n=1 Tax=Trichogramma brassicae TaxID=86971 RepID=A0A6H5J9K6_9HYME|nr:unnamed protein product [Trichogramma brassicae]